MEQVKVKIELNFKDGKKIIEMELKVPEELEDCKEGKAIILNLLDGQSYTGIFKGIDEEYISLQSLSGKNTLGFELEWVGNYLEQIKE